MKVYGHPWSINTRKVLMVLAEKGKEAELSLVMLPKGEQKLPAHVALHPFAKVPVLDDQGFVVYESAAINHYLERKFPTPALVPSDPRSAALCEQWRSAIDAYFVPHAAPVIVESLFRRYLGGESDLATIENGREKMQLPLAVADRALQTSPYLAGEAFSLADIHLMPFLEYLEKLSRDVLAKRPGLAAWWERVSRRPSWQQVARSGAQPYEVGMAAEVIENQLRPQASPVI
jgi:glutathione S-transferase